MRREPKFLTHRKRRAVGFSAATLALSLGASALVAHWAWSDPSDAFDAAVPASQSADTVTLITGDRVTVHSDGVTAPRVDPGDGRENIPVDVRQLDGKVTVTPADAMPLIAAGLVDQRLFDVTALLESGYGDQARDDVPLIVEGGDVGSSEAEVTRDLPGLGATAASQPKSSTGEFWAATTAAGDAAALSGGVERVWLDGKREPLLEESVPQIGAPEAWDAGYTGEDTTVAVLDTGVDSSHPDLDGKIADSENFTADEPGDDVGHGTHVAATVAGDGEYTGVAPDAQILDGKVCEAFGCEESAILAGMEWAAESGATAVNLSLGGPASPQGDPLEDAVESLTDEHGTLFVVAAGNDGDDAAVNSPGTAPSALTVGAVDKDDALAEFSSRGPSIHDSAIKPDVTAPGEDIVAACVEGSDMGCEDGGHVSASGTSMATPHAAGAVALLAQQHPDHTPDMLKAMVAGSAEPNPDLGAYAQGAGRVDAAAASEQTVHAEPASVSAGLQEWPHDDNEPVTETVSYHNFGDEDLVFDLTVEGQGPDGDPAPEGMFTVDVDQVEVPAGGEAEFEVTVDTTVDSEVGYFSAVVAAEADDESVVTPVAVDKEVESYEVSMEALDSEGASAETAGALLLSLDSPALYEVHIEDGEGSLRVPAGDYHVEAVVSEGGDDVDDWEGSMLVQPQVTVDEDVALTYDAREAEPVSVTLDADAEQSIGAATYVRETDAGGLLSLLLAENFDQLSVAGLGDPVADEEMETKFDGLWKSDDATYHLSWLESGHMPTGFERDVAEDDLARVEADYRSHQQDGSGIKHWSSRGPSGFGSSMGVEFDLPQERVEFHNVEDGLEWHGMLDMSGADVEMTDLMESTPVDHEAGETYTETWNAAAAGPALPDHPEWVWAARMDDVVELAIPMYSDAAADHFGRSMEESARTALYADGDLIDEADEMGGSGSFEVPAEETEYLLEVESTRHDEAQLSTEIHAEWTFVSESSDEEEVLPLSTARFAPEDLDEHNHAEAGGSIAVPISIDSQLPELEVDSLDVEVSFDDGEEWQELDVVDDDGQLSVDVDHPDDAEFVSLRAALVDADGNTAEVTIVRAYGLI